MQAENDVGLIRKLRRLNRERGKQYRGQVGRSLGLFDQPLTLLAHADANCCTALQQREDVDPKRIGIVALSYGGKWSMFSSCLDQRFACAVWPDPGSL